MSGLDSLCEDTLDAVLAHLSIEETWWSQRHLPNTHSCWPRQLIKRYGSFKKVFRILMERATGSRKRAIIERAFFRHWEDFSVTRMALIENMESTTELQQIRKAMVAALATGISITWKRLPALIHEIEHARTVDEVSKAIEEFKGHLLNGSFDDLYGDDMGIGSELCTIHDRVVNNYCNPNAHSEPLFAWIDRPR